MGDVSFRGTSGGALGKLADNSGYTNGPDTYYVTKLSDGGTLVLYRFEPFMPSITSDPYPEVDVPGNSASFVAPTRTPPFFAEQTVAAPYSFASPYSQIKWPAMITNAGAAVFFLSESPLFEEAIEPFLSAYRTIQIGSTSSGGLALRFDQSDARARSAVLHWAAVDRSASSTTYVAPVVDQTVRTLAIHLQSGKAKRVWYFSGNAWTAAQTVTGGPTDPNLLLVSTRNPTKLLVETEGKPPADQSTFYSTDVGYVDRARWSAFTVYQRRDAVSFWRTSMVPSMKAYNDLLARLGDSEPANNFPTSWRDLLKQLAFTPARNILNPKFFDNGFAGKGDPLFDSESVKTSVSWVSDDAALQAVMGSRLYGFSIDARYGQGVGAFYDATADFYWGAYNRATHTRTSADTGGEGVIVGYNYLLSLTRLTELIGTRPGLPAAAVERLVDRVVPLLVPGYISGYSQIPYLWRYPALTGVQWEYGMGKELSEAQLSYICGLWWLRTHVTRYHDCEIEALRLPERLPLTFRGSAYLWGLDVVHGGYVLDALLLAYQTTGDRHYLDAAIGGWREELLFLFSKFNYPETPFDDRAMAVTSFVSTFADLHVGNTWRADSWNNERSLWSLAKVLGYVDDPRIVQLLDLANATHKQSMPIVDATYNPIQQSDILNRAIDPNDFELNYEALRYHYSTQVSFSTDVWREAFLFSIHSSGGQVYRIPGIQVGDPGLAYVVGKPGSVLKIVIDTLDCTFENGATTASVQLNADGVARVSLRLRA